MSREDLKWQRFDGNVLSPWGVRRENIEAFLWPSLIAAALWTGMPTLNFRQLWGVVVGFVCFALLVLLNRRCKTATQGSLRTGAASQLDRRCGLAPWRE